MEQLNGHESSPSRQQCGCAVMRFHSGVGEDGDIWGGRMGCGVADGGSGLVIKDVCTSVLASTLDQSTTLPEIKVPSRL